MAKNRDRILAEWSKRYDGKSAPKKRSSSSPHTREPARGEPWPSAVREVAVGLRPAGMTDEWAALISKSATSPSATATSPPSAISSRYRRGRVRLLPRALGLRQDHPAARHRRPRSADLGHDPPEGPGHIARCRQPKRDFGIVFQSYALFPNLTVADNVGYGLVSRRLSRGRDREARRRACWRWSGCPSRAEISRPAVGRPAAARGAGPRARDRRLGCCCSTSRCRRSMRACALRLRHEIRRLQRTARRHHHHGDARPGRGAHHGRPHRGDEPGRDRAGRHAAGDLPPSGHRLRRRLRRAR